jgi:predicted metal-dependent enzyme (double-stranded beta helix superfamily)
MSNASEAQVLPSRATPPLAAFQAADPVALLAKRIEAACDGPSDAMRGRIVGALEQAIAAPDLLRPDQRAPRPGCYARHILYADPGDRFTIVAIVWGPGQFSPPHAHDTWCAYAVLERSLQETLFAWDPATASARPAGLEIRRPGYGCFDHAGLDQIHQLGNPGSEPAISIHVYGVGRDRVTTDVNRMVEIAA